MLPACPRRPLLLFPRWINIRMDALGGMFAAGLGAWIVYGPTRNTAHASDTGFSLTMAGMPLYIFMSSRNNLRSP